MASRAEVSITIVREPLGVVTEDLVLRAFVPGGQCIYAVKNVVDLLGKKSWRAGAPGGVVAGRVKR